MIKTNNKMKYNYFLFKTTLKTLIIGVTLLSSYLVSAQTAIHSESFTPTYLSLSSDGSTLTYQQNVGENTPFVFLSLTDFTSETEVIQQFTENHRYGDVIIGRGKIEDSQDYGLISVRNKQISIDNYYDGNNYASIFAQLPNGAFFGSGRVVGQTAGRDIIRVSEDLSTVTNPANSRTGSGNDLINKDKYKIHMAPFGDNKLLIKAFRNGSDEEYFVWDDLTDTYTQITDASNSNSGTTYDTQWPLAKAFGGSYVGFFYEDKLYATDGTVAGVREIADATNMQLEGIGGTNTSLVYGNEVAGDNELYLYAYDGTTEKVDLNSGGSSNPTDFVSNGDLVYFIADDGDGFEPYISNGTAAGTMKLANLNEGTAGSVFAVNDYQKRSAYAVDGGFIFKASKVGIQNQSSLFFTDGENVVELDNGDGYGVAFNVNDETYTLNDEYFYIADFDDRIIQIAIPDNIFTNADWTNALAANQSLYFSEDYSFGASITVHSLHIPSGVTVTVPNGVTLTVTNDVYGFDNIVIEDGGTVVWEAGEGDAVLADIQKHITKSNALLSTAEAGDEIGKFGSVELDELITQVAAAQNAIDNETNQVELISVYDELYEAYHDAVWSEIMQENYYQNEIVDMVGDVKQAFILDRIWDKEQVDNLLIGMRASKVNGVRVPIFAKGLAPNEEMLDYFTKRSIERGFEVMANPALFQGAKRIANNMFLGPDAEQNGSGDPVNGDAAKTQIVIDRMIEFASQYELTWISPLNEDGNGSSETSWSIDQIHAMYEGLQGNVGGAMLIGGDCHNIEASNGLFDDSNIENYIVAATTHNLEFQHELWSEFMTKAGDLPVWDSEATDNVVINEKGEELESRLVAARDAGVEGIVHYNSWNLIDLATGELTSDETLIKYIATTVLSTGITVSGPNELVLGETGQLTVTEHLPLDVSNNNVLWLSSNESIATVDEEGNITTLAAGTTVLSAIAEDGSGIVSNDISLTVTKVAVSTISVTGSASLAVGTTEQYAAEVLPENASDKSVTWSSSDESIATVDAEGNVTAVAEGTVTITATSVDDTSINGTISVTVTDGVLSVSAPSQGVKVYPNPFIGSFKVDVNVGGHYTLYTVLGTLIATGELTVGDNQIDLQGYASGLYVLTIESVEGKSKHLLQKK